MLMTPISSFINGQRMHWVFGPATRQNEEETVWEVSRWKIRASRLRGASRKRRLDVAEENVKKMEIQKWMSLV